MPAFVYRPRTNDQMKRREMYQNDFKGYLINDVTLWKPKKGSNSIRILPATWPDAEHYGLDVYLHYQIGPERATVLCLAKMKGERCPLCEEQQRLLREDEESPDAKALRAGRSVIMWIIDRDEEKKGPQVFACAPGLDQDIVKVSEDKQTRSYKMIDDPNRGYDVYFDKEGDKLQTKYKGVQIASRASSVDPAHIEFIAELPLPDILEWRDYAEVDRLFRGEPSAPPEPVREEPRRSLPRVRVSVKDEPEPPQRRARDEDDELERERAAIDARTRDEDPPFESEPPRRTTPPPPPPPASSTASGSSRAAAIKERLAARNR